MKLTRTLIAVLLLLSFASCKKLVEDKKRDVLIQIITNGQWHIETFMEGGDSITTQFSGYNFKFNENGTVYAKNGTVLAAGSWEGDIDNYTIISTFPDGPEPLRKLNGIWKIKDSSLEYVAAEMTTVQGRTILHLRRTI